MERKHGFYDDGGFVPLDSAPETLVMPNQRWRVYLLSVRSVPRPS